MFRFYFALSFLLLPLGAYAQSVDFEYALAFSDPVYISHEYRTALDCDSEIGFNVGDEAYLKRDLGVFLAEGGVSFDEGARYKLKLYVTHFDCGSTGKESYKSYPLGLGFKQENISGAYLRVVTELEDGKTGEVLAMREYIALATLEEHKSRFLFFSSNELEKEVQMSELWKPIAREAAGGIVEDLK